MSKTPGSDDAYDSAAYWEETAEYDFGDLNAAINALDLDDPNYNDRYTTLIERLMCADMAMGPARRAMCRCVITGFPPPPPIVHDAALEEEMVDRYESGLARGIAEGLRRRKEREDKEGESEKPAE